MAPHIVLFPLPTLLIHWQKDWEASLAIWENNVISRWAELLDPLWDYSLLHAFVITDHVQKKEKELSARLYACIFTRLSSDWWIIFNRLEKSGSLSTSTLLCLQCLLSGCVLKSNRIRLCSTLHFLVLHVLEYIYIFQRSKYMYSEDLHTCRHVSSIMYHTL